MALTNGIAFLEKGDDVDSQLVSNVQFINNWIHGSQTGISIMDVGIRLRGFEIVGNTIISGATAGIFIYALDQNPQEADAYIFKRDIKGNALFAGGAGIINHVSGVKVVDNNIHITYIADTNTIYGTIGVVILNTNCTVTNNSIYGTVDIDDNIRAYGGILLATGQRFFREEDQIQVTNNRITGGISNGIEIGSDLNGLIIKGNHISEMGLNGIAVRLGVRLVSNLQIKNNTIKDCHRLLRTGDAPEWDNRYAGIVLTRTRKTQIIGNIICDNGNSVQELGIPLDIGAFYAENIKEIIISNNQFINNGLPRVPSNQAVIHVFNTFETIPDFDQLNSDIQIVNNIVKGLNSPALLIGTINGFDTNGDGIIDYGADSKAVISNNHFESSYRRAIVRLQISQCIFASNYVSCDPRSVFSVRLGYGLHVMANGNVVSSPITGVFMADPNIQRIINNMDF